MGQFETSDSNSHMNLKPLRVPSTQDGIYGEAKEMVEDLPDWTLKSADDEKRILVCQRKGGLLSGEATITITVEGPDGIPSSIVNCKSESSGGLMSRDKANVLEFMRPFHRRVC